MAACSMPGSLKSSVYLPRPVMSEGSSRRLIEEPMIPGMDSTPFLAGAGDGFYGFDDVVVPGAAAKVALQALANLLLRRVRIVGEEPDRGEDHPRCAVTALQTVVVPERLLQRMELAVGRQTLDRRHRASFGLERELRARLDRQAIDQHGARAAQARLAA